MGGCGSAVLVDSRLVRIALGEVDQPAVVASAWPRVPENSRQGVSGNFAEVVSWRELATASTRWVNLVFAYDFAAESPEGTGPDIPFGFTGREHDASGLRYHRDRYVAPVTGKWLQPDRLGLKAGPNQYQYVNSMPTIAADPMGERTLILYGDPGVFQVESGGKLVRWVLNFETRPSYERELKRAFLAATGEASVGDIDAMEFSHQADLVEVASRETYYETVLYFGHGVVSAPLLRPNDALNLSPKEFAFLMYGNTSSKKRTTPKNILLAGCDTASSGFQSQLSQYLPLTIIKGVNGFLSVGLRLDSAPPHEVREVYASGTIVK